MRMGQTLIFLVLLMIAFSAIIDPAPGTLGDVSKSPLTSTSHITQLDHQQTPPVIQTSII